MEHNSGSIFQRRAGVTSERVWLRQKILEPTNEGFARVGRSGWLPISAVAAKIKNTVANPSGRFFKTSAKPQENFQQPDQYLRHARLFLCGEIQGNISKNKDKAHICVRSKTLAWGPHMNYWPQQLNLAVFCATQGCGVSREIFDSGLKLTPQIRAFYQFHVYFTARRILFQMGGIQSISALPGDPTFNVTDNHYDIASYKRICAEFGIDSTSDFRFTGRKNHGLGDVYIGVSGHGAMKTGQAYPGGFYKFGDEGGKAKDGNLLDYIELDAVAYSQYDWFAPNKASGLTQAGLARVNQSIEAFVYCILGAQVNVRSSILGEGGRAKEAQTEFLTLMENAIRQPDLAKSVQRYQLAVDEAKVRLNLAVCPGAWLMPARMIINTESTVGYNNKLKQAAPGMKLGVNNDVNPGTKKAGIIHMEGGPSKINPPKPSNPMQTAAQDPRPPKRVRLPSDEVGQIEEEMIDKTPQHEINKTAVIIGVVGVAALLILATR